MIAHLRVRPHIVETIHGPVECTNVVYESEGKPMSARLGWRATIEGAREWILSQRRALSAARLVSSIES